MNHKQRPALHDESRGEFYFYAALAPVPVPNPVGPAIDIDREDYQRAEQIGTIASYKAYQQSHPDGRYRAYADAAIAKLQGAELPRVGSGQGATSGGPIVNNGSRLATPPTEQSPVRAAGTLFRDCQTCPEMVVIPSGSFLMGSPEGEGGRVPAEGL